jgi:Dolichyl-phosphate-mannose-protein mannosyltransferase
MNTFNAHRVALVGALLLALAGLAVSVESGLTGIDFGEHWDEPTTTRAAIAAVASGLLLPRWYQYPSISFDVALATAIPAVLRAHEAGKTLENAAAGIRLPEFTLRVRSVFLVLTDLSAVWVFLTVLFWRRSAAEAALAALLLLSSWELAYHARWVAPDGLLMSFGSLSMLLMVTSVGSLHPRRWLFGAAVAVGAALASKYPGGIFLVPLLLAAKMGRERDVRRIDYLMLLAVVGAVFISTSPGIVLEPIAFIHDLSYVMNQYATVHGCYTVAPLGEHLRLMTEWLTMVSFSHWPPLACAVAALALVGAAELLWHDRRRALLLLSVPVLYLAYFSLQHVMIVRNLLVLLPLVAILSSHGAFAIFAELIRPSERPLARPLQLFGCAALGLALSVILIANFVWLQHSAASIATRATIDRSTDIVNYVQRHARVTFFLTNAARAAIGDDSARRLANLRQTAGEAELIIFLSSEATRSAARSSAPAANRYGIYDLVSGPMEVNWDYYPTWPGDARVLSTSSAIGRLVGAAQ